MAKQQTTASVMEQALQQMAIGQEFRFQALPPELRLHIYDAIFTPLVQQHGDLDPSRYRDHTEWPRQNNFTAYTNLLLTCKDVSAEASKHWKIYYAAKCTFHFWELASLHHVATSLLALGAPYSQATFILRHRPNNAMTSLTNPAADTNLHPIDDLVMNFMDEQEGWDPDWTHHSTSFRASDTTPGTHDIGDGFSLQISEHENQDDRLSKKTAVFTFPPLPTCKVWAYHEFHLGVSVTHLDTLTTVLQGTFATAMLGGYDPLEGWEVLLWWREFEARGFPTAKAERMAVYRHVQEVKVSDEMWRRLGGTLMTRERVLHDGEKWELQSWVEGNWPT